MLNELKEDEKQTDTELKVINTKIHNEILDKLNSINNDISNINKLTKTFQDILAFEEEKKEFIKNLFSEPQRYKDDFYFDIIKPLIISIIRFKDGLEKDIYNFELHSSERKIDDETIKFINVFKSATEDISDILELYDIFAYKCEESKFNPLKQIGVKIIPTEDETLFKTVFESLSYGYERNGYIISKEKVSVYTIKTN